MTKKQKQIDKKKSTGQKDSTKIVTPTASDQLLAYSQHLKDGLKHGMEFTQIIDTLVATKDYQELFNAIRQLAAYDLNTAYVTYPQQYSKSDYYLLFLNRLSELARKKSMNLQSEKAKLALSHQFPGIEDQSNFVFTKLDQAKAYYTEVQSGQDIFYLDFKDGILRFNSEAFTKLLLQKYQAAAVPQKVLLSLVDYFLDLGLIFKEQYGFDVDFNVLDPDNHGVYPMISDKTPEAALDRLFIQAQKANYRLQTDIYSRAILELNGGITLTAFDVDLVEEGKGHQWVLGVRDEKQEVSLVKLLLKYDFLRDWYLTNQAEVAIRSDARYF